MELTLGKLGVILTFLGSAIALIPTVISVAYLKVIVERIHSPAALKDVVERMHSQINSQRKDGLSEADVHPSFDFSDMLPSMPRDRYQWSLPFAVLLIFFFLASMVVIILFMAHLGAGPDLVTVIETFKDFWLYVLAFLILLVAFELAFFAAVVISVFKSVGLSFIVYMVNGNYNRRFAITGLIIGAIGTVLIILY